MIGNHAAEKNGAGPWDVGDPLAEQSPGAAFSDSELQSRASTLVQYDRREIDVALTVNVRRNATAEFQHRLSHQCLRFHARHSLGGDPQVETGDSG